MSYFRSADCAASLVVGDPTVRGQALEGGSIDATILDGVFSRQAKANGRTTLADFSQANLPMMNHLLVTKKNYLQRQPQIVENVLRALIEGLAFTWSPKNKSAVLKSVMRHECPTPNLIFRTPKIGEEPKSSSRFVQVESLGRRTVPSIAKRLERSEAVERHGTTGTIWARSRAAPDGEDQPARQRDPTGGDRRPQRRAQTSMTAALSTANATVRSIREEL